MLTEKINDLFSKLPNSGTHPETPDQERTQAHTMSLEQTGTPQTEPTSLSDFIDASRQEVARRDKRTEEFIQRMRTEGHTKLQAFVPYSEDLVEFLIDAIISDVKKWMGRTPGNEMFDEAPLENSARTLPRSAPVPVPVPLWYHPENLSYNRVHQAQSIFDHWIEQVGVIRKLSFQDLKREYEISEENCKTSETSFRQTKALAPTIARQKCLFRSIEYTHQWMAGASNVQRDSSYLQLIVSELTYRDNLSKRREAFAMVGVQRLGPQSGALAALQGEPGLLNMVLKNLA